MRRELLRRVKKDHSCLNIKINAAPYRKRMKASEERGLDKLN